MGWQPAFVLSLTLAGAEGVGVKGASAAGRDAVSSEMVWEVLQRMQALLVLLSGAITSVFAGRYIWREVFGGATAALSGLAAMALLAPLLNFAVGALPSLWRDGTLPALYTSDLAALAGYSLAFGMCGAVGVTAASAMREQGVGVVSDAARHLELADRVRLAQELRARR